MGFKVIDIFNVPLSPDDTTESSCQFCSPQNKCEFEDFFSSNAKFIEIKKTLPQFTVQTAQTCHQMAS